MDLRTVFRRFAIDDRAAAKHGAAWLQQHMSTDFFQAMRNEQQALACLIRDLTRLRNNRSIILADRPKLLMLARVNQPGSLYDTLLHVGAEDISCARFYHSDAPMPEMQEELEVMLFESDRRQSSDIAPKHHMSIPQTLARKIRAELRNTFQAKNSKGLEPLLRIIWMNNERFVRHSPPLETASLIWLLWASNASGGLFLDIRPVFLDGRPTTRILFGVGNLQEKTFLLQTLEVFRRLDIAIRQSCCITIHNGIHPYFLGSFHVTDKNGMDITTDSYLSEQLTKELYATQILASNSAVYRDFVVKELLSGEDAALVNAFIAFCHTTLGHNQPDRYDLDSVQKAFYDHPEMARLMIDLFRTRFNPDANGCDIDCSRQLGKARKAVESYNTGHRWLDDMRRTVYNCCILFITHTLKTNFFIAEKQALAFRLDPSYLHMIGNEFNSDLPELLPFRITFFFSRFGAGYHIGFSDIARGGWRTVIARSKDDYITLSNTLFREVYVLAHTQHLKNKDIYEGGSKMVTVLDACDLAATGGEEEACLLYKLQYSIANAFLDIFVTEKGRARDRRVLDYYRDDEPIELGPDENMHDSMIEAIARLSRKRNYMLDIGIISSKHVGINHKEYGVTSTGVMEFARIAMAEVCGIDIGKDAFSLKMTGGTNGDVAGNMLRILLSRCPAAEMRLIVAGTAALYDPNGIHKDELRRLVLKRNLDTFNPDCLGVGAFIIYRTERRMEGLRETHRKLVKTREGLVEQWLDLDEFNRQYGSLIFSVKADLFIPAGGRPETIDSQNWSQFLDEHGSPSSRLIVEGANSFITPDARIRLQKSGVVILRDASANKCGVISSSYEIIANLLLSEKEFMEHKQEYVRDVLSILEKRAADEARLILRRRRESGDALLCTEISDSISQEINANYARLFSFFSARPELCLRTPYRRALLKHLPQIMSTYPAFRQRIRFLPVKYQCAILAAEISSSLVYAGDMDAVFESMIRKHLALVL